MDLITQGILGAVVSQTQARAKELGKAAVVGALAGMSADLDVLIRSSTDPLLFLEFHRQFTHSLLFIPMGGLLASLVLYPLLGKRWGLSFLQIFVWSMLGYATHGLLDGCTAYGTQLLWPLSNERFAWSSISIIDPLFSLPLLLFVILGYWRHSRIFSIIAMLWVISYLSFGFIQHQRALSLGKQLAHLRGHTPIRMDVKPSLGNLIIWRLNYEYEGKYYIDALKPGSHQKIWEGSSLAKLDIPRDFPWLDKSSQYAKDIERFRWFADDYLVVDPNNKQRIIDLRYSLAPNKVGALWGIELSQDASNTQHVGYSMEHRHKMSSFNLLWSMITE
ncbi:MAG: metal-dependent hydrolase [Thiotrichaceae bacterium]|nr:metal-dependent hydrolase [Thiotrichaceae bacterium]